MYFCGFNGFRQLSASNCDATEFLEKTTDFATCNIVPDLNGAVCFSWTNVFFVAGKMCGQTLKSA